MNKYYSKVIAIGDSHVGNFSNICNILTFGPETLYRIGNGSIVDHITHFRNTGDLSSDYLWIYCFGEIDVRCHIHKQVITYQRDINEIVNTLVDRYFNFILPTNQHIAVCGVVPPAKIHNKENRLQDTINSKYPFIGPDNDRKEYTIKLNKCLVDTCQKNNIPYIDMYTDYHIDGYLNEQLAGDLIHISHKQYVENKLSLINNITNYI